MTKVTLNVNLGGLAMKNPVTVASGAFGYGDEYEDYFDVSRLGAVTVKSLSLKPRPGNKPPRIVETPAGMLNAIGLQNIGLETYLKEKLPVLREKGCVIIANIYGYSPEEYAELARRIENENGADALEANLSCPNVHDARCARGGALVAQFPERVKEYTQAVKAATSLPVFIKLSPNVTDIVASALAAQEGGADAVSLINTLLGMDIDIEKRRPKLGNIVGGLSGPAIRPVAVKMVWDAARALNIPVLGMGGICSAEDALQFLLVGATAVAVGCASFRRPDAALKVVEGIEAYCLRHGIQDINALIGGLNA